MTSFAVWIGKCVVVGAFAVSALAQNGPGGQFGPGERNGFLRAPHPLVPRAPQGYARPYIWVVGGPLGPNPPIRPSTPGPPFAPSDLQSVYGLTSLTGYPASNGGKGVTVAIVDAFDQPNIVADVATFSTDFGLPQMDGLAGDPTFSVVFQGGTRPVCTLSPSTCMGWRIEISLDVEWVHAIAPFANIVLVEAQDSSGNNLFAAAGSAVSIAKGLAPIVSNSYGGGEFGGESAFDSVFSGSSAILFSSGDTGGIVQYPAVSNNVIAVGGTTIGLTGGVPTVPSVDTAWSGTGGGCSLQSEPLLSPNLQRPLVPSTCTHRAVPDVAMEADPNTGVFVLDSADGGFFQVGGTSLACPMWAGILAIVDGLRLTAAKTTLTTATALNYLYSAAIFGYTGHFRDVVSGTAGSFSAMVGWDFTTGLGVPVANTLIPFVVSLP